ncbi:arginine deiminase type-3 [Moelleriella libera RCEF 2490]|uniref:Arginine deiminase type-3 n=1 Tax=Moelleriella libera RCEF 2490 TaxID=1081109 RepID=A0A166U648_9HYPO|nr:arginine deiminase type-3 [Moelleriella libera RCEF 2490]
MRMFSGLLFISAAATAADALKVTILGDTNRDGVVDMTGDSDLAGKEIWTNGRGALFLANIGDTNSSCSQSINEDTPAHQIDQCHDASGEIQKNPKYLAPLRTTPISDLTASARGRVFVSGPHASGKVRIFHDRGHGQWAYVNEVYEFGPQDLRPGLVLGIDARDVRRPDGWDGRVVVHFNVTDNGETASDRIALRVAPVLTHHPVQRPDQVFTADTIDGPQIGPQMHFVNEIRGFSKEAGVEKPVVVMKTKGDVWVQDFFEPGYTSIPGPDGPVYLRIMIRSRQNGRSAGREVFATLRSDTVGGVQHMGNSSAETIDFDSGESLGNLETIPPYSHNGQHFPAGRCVMGRH